MKLPCIVPGCSFFNKLFSSKASDFETEALEVHNEYRAEHGAPPLVLNKEMCKYSQKWAEELAKKDAMQYSLSKEYGESIYCGWSLDHNTKVTARDSVEKWYSEINDYSFGKEPEILTCGHFTQLVWKNTKELGVGSAKSKTGKLYVVAVYYPPGNYKGQFAKNVLPPGANKFRITNLQPPLIKETSTDKSPPSPRASKNLGDVATNLVNRLKSTSISGDEFEEEFLRTHNEYRLKHGVPPLVLSKKLSKYADEWAKTLAKKGKMEHREQNEYGENIFFAWSSDPNFKVSGSDPVLKWYSEIKDHKFGAEPTNLGTGHFTQVVWEDTKEVGVGVGRSKEGQVYVVANYYPPGNVVGSFATKVPPPLR